MASCPYNQKDLEGSFASRRLVEKALTGKNRKYTSKSKYIQGENQMCPLWDNVKCGAEQQNWIKGIYRAERLNLPRFKGKKGQDLIQEAWVQAQCIHNANTVDPSMCTGIVDFDRMRQLHQIKDQCNKQ